MAYSIKLEGEIVGEFQVQVKKKKNPLIDQS